MGISDILISRISENLSESLIKIELLKNLLKGYETRELELKKLNENLEISYQKKEIDLQEKEKQLKETARQLQLLKESRKKSPNLDY